VEVWSLDEYWGVSTSSPEPALEALAVAARHDGRGHCDRRGLLVSDPGFELAIVGDGQCLYRLGPVADRTSPVGSDVPQCMPDQLCRCIITQKRAARSDDLGNSCMGILDPDGCAIRAPHSWRGRKERNGAIPGSTPDHRDDRNPFAPRVALEFHKRLKGGVFAERGVDRAQRLRANFAVVPAHVLQGASKQAHDVRLRVRLQKCRFQALWSAAEVLDEDDQDSPVTEDFYVVDNFQRDLRRLGAPDPDPQDLARPICQQAQDEVDRPVPSRRAVAHRRLRRTGKHRRVDWVERAAVLSGDLHWHPGGDGVHDLRGNLRAMLLGEKPLNFMHRYAAGVYGDDHVIEAREAPLVLGYQQRLEAALTAFGDVDAQWAVFGQLRLRARAIAMRTCVLGLPNSGALTQVNGELRPQVALDQGRLIHFRVPHRGSVNPSPLGDGPVGRI